MGYIGVEKSFTDLGVQGLGGCTRVYIGFGLEVMKRLCRVYKEGGG